MKSFVAMVLVMLLVAAPAHAEAVEVLPVGEGVHALVGPLGQRAPDNLGNNATFGAVVTPAGVVLIDSGGSAKGAAMIERALRGVTDKPVVAVINTGGQDHRWLGNGYFRARGAEIIASEAAVADQQARADDQFRRLRALIGPDNLAGTEAVVAGRTFADSLSLTLGGVRLELRHVGPAHTPGDSVVWLPEQRIAFAGDVVYVDRLLGIMSFSNSKNWLAAFDAVAALNPEVVVPGHGRPASLAKARAQTRDYLAHLRAEVGAVLDAGGSIYEGMEVNQSAFAHLANFDNLAGRNAQAVFMEMEFE